MVYRAALSMALVLLAAACGSSGDGDNGAGYRWSGEDTIVFDVNLPPGGDLFPGVDAAPWPGSCGSGTSPSTIPSGVSGRSSSTCWGPLCSFSSSRISAPPCCASG